MTVQLAAVYAETITVTGSTTSFSSLSDTAQLSATATNPRLGNVTSQVTFAWSSSSPGVAGVSNAGLVTAVGNGNTAVSASWNGVSGSIPIAVAQVAVSVSASTSTGGTSASLASLGETVQLVGTAKDAKGFTIAGATFGWTSDAPAVATVSSGGVVTAVANGSAHVVARATSNQVASPAPGLAVTVQQAVASVSVLPASASRPRCTTQQFAAVPRDGRGNTVAGAPAATWSPATGTIATVNASGLATTVNVGGPVAITAKIAGVSGIGQLTVTVNSSPIVVNWNSSAAVTPVNVTICAGQSVVWRNTETNVVHTATGTPAPPPDTGAIQPGASSPAQTFPTPGQYHYLCLNHPAETGTVTVNP
jgi:plastocyanin